MVNLKTKIEKHTYDNEKRLQSLKEKEKAKQKQSEIIKQALTSSLSNSSKKIVFNEDDDAESHNNVNNHSKNEKTKLFDESNSEDENFEIKEKIQFHGKKGMELLNLQSTYGSDDRFKIDERFLDDDEGRDVFKKNKRYINNDVEQNDVEEEKTKQLKILETVLGEPVSTPNSEIKKAKKRTFEMVRYDVSNKDHEKYEIKPEVPLKLKKASRKLRKSVTTSTPKPEVSKEKFYEVSNSIKSVLHNDKEQGGSFSLLQTYGQNENSTISDDGYHEDVDVHEESDENVDNFNDKSKLKQNRTSIIEEPKAPEKNSVVKGVWKESFFFVPEDPRFKEGLEFINKKDSDEAYEAAENYDKTRRKLKEILRLHMKKQLHRKDPFKTKIGGMNKKQLASLKSKNAKNFGKKRVPKA